MVRSFQRGLPVANCRANRGTRDTAEGTELTARPGERRTNRQTDRQVGLAAHQHRGSLLRNIMTCLRTARVHNLWLFFFSPVCLLFPFFFLGNQETKMTAKKPQGMLREASHQIIAGGSAGESDNCLTSAV